MREQPSPSWSAGTLTAHLSVSTPGVPPAHHEQPLPCSLHSWGAPSPGHSPCPSPLHGATGTLTTCLSLDKQPLITSPHRQEAPSPGHSPCPSPPHGAGGPAAWPGWPSEASSGPAMAPLSQGPGTGADRALAAASGFGVQPDGAGWGPCRGPMPPGGLVTPQQSVRNAPVSLRGHECHQGHPFWGRRRPWART